MPRLIVSEPGFDAREFEVEGVVTIGRSSDNTVVLRDERASRHHARIMASGDQYIIEDLKSSNGTTVNGLRVQRKALRHGDEVAIGKVRMLFRDEKAGDLIGSVLGGYRILSKIGHGGMGAVYRAHQISMDRIVALKVLKKELTQNREFVRGFLQEARVAGHLNHPAIIQVHDFGEDKGTYYFSMEFVEGETVQAILDREGKLPVEKALEIAISVVEALCHARMHQVVHQDIKPQNIMVDRAGNVKLADLGLAVVGGRQRPEQKAGPAVIMGTPHYMAPEQGKREKIDSRTDIYSLGCTLFHMVTGRVPFDGPNSLAVITKHITHERPNPRQYDITLPESLCNLIRWMMAIDPKDRPQTPEVVLDALKKIRAELEQREKARAASHPSSGMVRRRAPIPPRPRTAGQTPVAAGGGLLVLGTAFFVLLAIVVVGVMMLMRDPGARDGRGRGGGERNDGVPPAKKTPAPDDRKNPDGKTAPPVKGETGTAQERPETPRPGPAAAPEADPAKAAAGEAAARALEAALDAHRRAIASGDFLRARSLLRRFVEAHGGTAKAARAADALRELDDAVETALRRIAEQAEKHIAARNYPAAAVECGKLLSYDPHGGWGKRARELLDACDAGAEPVFRKLSADADEALKKGNLQDAIDIMDSCLD
ncbi:MAG: FHA domain-containing serine/threonine-protein kinase, partial [Planctomycetota bacterium]|nr:FHA domain-containing serine/threonine-protein kinase [Planctomycetota bacterium]